ncbi:MAG: hypothetical protein UDL61_01815 [Ruminococcus callidus]|uniref:hypothetical protein n=1 Tax=Ruminococcus callidus TaxID=40519 RepID=UPI002E79ABA6|nr:hypothetical protein [Ruminococcus callidus]MEE0505311.1 hypothetical protein [Ruminococcus callidus]
MKEQNQIIQWIKAHKKQLILAGIGIAAVIALVLGIKNKDMLKALWASLKGAVEPTAERISDAVTTTVTEIPTETPALLLSNDPCVPQEVRRHIRNLHEGWHASPEKLAAAREMGIILQEGQTWVDNYMKGVCAA